jgi:uncharacterized caspase-like protein
MTACEADEVAWEYEELGHSVFSYYILQGFNNLGDVDINNDGKASAEEFFYYVEPKVRAYTGEKQIPQLSDGYPGELNLFVIPSSSNAWIGGWWVVGCSLWQ